MKLNSDQVDKFNQKVRKANAKSKRRKRSKSNKNEVKEKEKSGSRNSSIKQLKSRVGKIIGQSRLTHDKEVESDDDKNYDSK